MMTNREFYEIWNAADSVKEAAEKAGMCVSACSQKAARLRALRVPMKMFGHSPKARAGELAEFVKEFAKKE